MEIELFRCSDHNTFLEQLDLIKHQDCNTIEVTIPFALNMMAEAISQMFDEHANAINDLSIISAHQQIDP